MIAYALDPKRARANDTGSPARMRDLEREADRPTRSAGPGSWRPISGFGPGSVRIHTDAWAAKSARALNADAYTVGADIFFGSGRFAPTAEPGQRLLAHELAHVQQQRSGLAPPNTVQRKSRAGETGDLLGFFDGADDAVKALDLLASMTDVDFNDTVQDMLKGSQFPRLMSHLPGRADIVRFLHLIGFKGNSATRDAVMAAYPLANISPESQLIVYEEQFRGYMGARGPTPDPALRALVSTDPSRPFTGGGATGTSPRAAPMGYGEMWEMRKEYNKARGAAGPSPAAQEAAVSAAKYTRTPGLEMLYDWTDPLKGGLVGAGGYLGTLSTTDRIGQAKLVLQQDIATLSRGAYGATLPSRAQVIRAAARAHNLEPELIGAIILAEQRDQSQHEDASDYQGATMGHHGTSIGLGQVEVATARNQNLFADLISPSMQSWLKGKTPETTSSIADLLASDEFNIFAVARFLRRLANDGATHDVNTMPNTKAWAGPIDMTLYGGTRQPGPTATSNSSAPNTRQRPGMTSSARGGESLCSRLTKTSRLRASSEQLAHQQTGLPDLGSVPRVHVPLTLTAVVPAMTLS